MDQQLQGVMQEAVFTLMVQGQIKACSEKCLGKPGKELTSNDKQCLAMCQDRYTEGFQKTFFQQYQKLIANMQQAQTDSQYPSY